MLLDTNDDVVVHEPVILGCIDTWVKSVEVSNSPPNEALNNNSSGEELIELPSIDKGFIT